MTGVILCGGQSTRMHRDKGLIPKGRYTWAAHAAAILKPFCSEVVMSVNRNQEHYAEALKDYLQIIDDENLEVHGPLLGLLSVHKTMPAEDLLVLACDMQEMKPEVPAYLLDQAAKQTGYNAWVFVQRNGEAEPLCGLYKHHALRSILNIHNLKLLPKYSMKYVLQRMHTRQIPIPETWESCFTNYNTPTEGGFMP